MNKSTYEGCSMKTKRTLLSIVVFFGIFWISIITDSYSHPYTGARKVEESANNHANDSAYDNVGESSIPTLYKSGSNTASMANRLYLSVQQDGTGLEKTALLSDVSGFQDNMAVSSVTTEADSFTDNTGNLTPADNRNGNGENPDGNPDGNQHSESDEINSDDGFSEENTGQNSAGIMASGRDGYEDIAPEEGPEITSSSIPSLYSDIGISIAETYVNIRDKASTDGIVLGKLYKDSAARILDSAGEWYYVESGRVKGYIKKEYLKTGIPDEELNEKYGTMRIKVITDGLNVREKPLMDAKKLTVIYYNEVYPAIELYGEWVKVNITNKNIKGYVRREYVELLVDFKKAVSREEEEELKRQQEEERMKKETQIKYRTPMDYTDEDLKLLACLVHTEAGDQCYEGRLAVANVVINRILSDIYPDTLKDVIYQPGQFAVVKNGSLAKQLAVYDNYNTQSQLLSIKAAMEAFEGANNIGNRLYFHSYKLAVKKGYDKKKNCVRIEDHLFW